MSALPMGDIVRELGLHFAVIGAQRGGSTFSADTLGQVSSIDLPDLEMPLFEDPWWSRTADLHQVQRAFRWEGALVRGIKRPDLFGHVEFAGRMRASGLRCVVVVLREPAIRTISATKWYFYVGRLPVPESIDEYLVDLIDRRDANAAITRFEREVVDYSRYGSLLPGWLDEFNGNAVVSTPSRVAEAPGDFVAQVAQQCGLSDHTLSVTPQRRRRTNPARVSSLEQARFLQKRLRFTKSWDNTAEFRLSRDGRRIRNAMSNRLAIGAVYGADRVCSIFRRERPIDVRQETLSYVREYFADEVRAFRSISNHCRRLSESW